MRAPEYGIARLQMENQLVVPGDGCRSNGTMNSLPTLRVEALTVLAAITLLAGCHDSSQRQPATRAGAEVHTSDELPAWLQVGPDDWGEKAWLEYQASLIELRTPILRSNEYTPSELITVTAEVECFPGKYEDKIKEEWMEKWGNRLTSYERTGGCGCCNEVYTVTGPKVAMEEFPDYYRNHYPRRTSTENGG